MREKQVVLFDLDGTVVDSMAGITRSYQYALAHFGVEVENPDTLARFVGPSLYRTFAEEYGFAGERLQTAVAKYREYFAEKGVFEHSLYPGMSGLIRGLAGQGRTLAVASCKVDVYTKQILEQYGLLDCFAFVGGSEMDGRRSSKAEIIRYVLDALGAPAPASAVMVGDRAEDMSGAHSEGVDGVGVLYGFGSREELCGAGAAALADDVPRLAALLGAPA